MPAYDYKCPKCEKVIEIVHRITETIHPLCIEEGCDGQVELERMIGATTFILKGNCWAKDGYKK